jgi:polyisoprenoid-binding protein YceI
MKSFFLLVMILGSFAAQAEKYTLDVAHTGVIFKIKHLVISNVTGRFEKFEGAIDFDEKTKKIASVDAKIDVDSINTNEPDRDKHLRSADFFGTRKEDGSLVEDKHYMTFKMKKATNKGDKPATIEGDLTVNGITKPVILNVEYKGATSDPWGNEKIVFVATAKIPRKDFALNWNKKLDKGGFVVGDDAEVIIEGEANKKKEEKKVEEKKVEKKEDKS